MDETGIPFSFLAVLFQNSAGSQLTGQDAKDYAADLGNPSHPVLADPSEQVLEFTDYDGSVLPGMCVLSPQMEMLECIEGREHDELFDVIRAHAQDER